eukprot:1522929-Rhodomonas_salina.1
MNIISTIPIPLYSVSGICFAKTRSQPFTLTLTARRGVSPGQPASSPGLSKRADLRVHASARAAGSSTALSSHRVEDHVLRVHLPAPHPT